MKPDNHITNLKCFKQVADVIGNMNAQRELFIVIYRVPSIIDINQHNLRALFRFYNAPQGGRFWYSISEGINPYTGVRTK